MAAVVKIEHLENGVAVVTLNSPATLNALDHAILQGLLDAVDAIAQSSARVLVLTAEGLRARRSPPPPPRAVASHLVQARG